MKIFDKELTIVSENENAITFTYGDKKYTIEKNGEFDPSTRYLYVGDKYYEDIPFHVSDGYAVCNGEYGICKIVKPNDLFGKHSEDGSMDDVLEATFPKLHDILTSEDLIWGGLAYYSDLESVYEGNILESYLESTWAKNVVTFFEGFFFFGGFELKVNGVERIF